MCQRTRRASRLITKAYDNALRPMGLRITQFTMLAAATASDGGASLSDVADLLGMDRTTLSRNLKPLERDGLIVFCDDEMRGRSRAIRITKKGETLFGKAEPIWRRVQSNLKSDLGPTEWKQFHTAITTASKSISS